MMLMMKRRGMITQYIQGLPKRMNNDHAGDEDDEDGDDQKKGKNRYTIEIKDGIGFLWACAFICS